jgi:hypothetical protein
MAWEIQRLHANQTFSIGVEPAEAVLRTQFMVLQNDPGHNGSNEDGWTIWTYIKAQAPPFNAIESIGMRMAAAFFDIGLAQMIVTDIDVASHPNKNNCYFVTQTSKAVLVGESPYRGLKISYQSSNRVVQQYIRPSAGYTNGNPAGSFPVGGNVVWPPTDLISNGTITNVMGNPIQYAVRQRIIRLEYLSHEPNAAIGYTNVPANPLLYVNHRNSDNFLGSPPGEILFQSYEQRYLSDQVKMDIYTFVDDAWLHLEQMPIRNPVDGSIWNDSTQSIGGSPVKVSGRAVWFQPYEKTSAFSTPGNILPTQILSLASNPAPVWQ